MLIKYDRRLSQEFVRYVFGQSHLLQLLRNPGARRLIDGREAPIDVQLRRNDEIALYAGQTKILSLRWDRNGVVFASKHYASPLTTPPFAPDSQLRTMWPSHRDTARINEGKFLAKEGFWQAMLAVRYGPRYRPGDPWCVLDAQVKVKFTEGDIRSDALAPIIWVYRQIGERLRNRPWINVPQDFGEDLGDRIDAIAVTPDGDLAVIEIKAMNPGFKAQQIYGGPLQVGFYVDLLDAYRDTMAEGIRGIVEQKQRLGLLPETSPTLRADFRIVPVIAIGDPNWRSSCWGTMEEVYRECARAKPQVFSALKVKAFVMEQGEPKSMTSIPTKGRPSGLPWN